MGVDESVDGVEAGFMFPLVSGMDASVSYVPRCGCKCGCGFRNRVPSEKQRGRTDLTDGAGEV